VYPSANFERTILRHVANSSPRHARAAQRAAEDGQGLPMLVAICSVDLEVHFADSS
jgi:hypothetical protein